MKSPSAVLKAVAGVVAAGALLVAPSVASAVPAVDGEFPVNGVGTNNEITLGPDGNMWVTLDAVNDVARITPEGVVTEFAAANITNPVGITTGPDGRLWVTQTNGVASFSTADPTTATLTAVPITTASAITTGPDGNLWTAADTKVYKIPPAAPATFETFTVVTGAKGIASSSDGALWVADAAGAALVRVTTAGVATPHPVGGGPQGVAAGLNGQIAYSNPLANPQEVGRLVSGGTPLTTPTPGADPFGVAFGTDQAYWFANFASNDLGRLTADGTFSKLTGFSAAAGPRRVAAGPGNTLWVTLDTANKIARVTGVDPPVVDPPPPPPPGTAPVTTIGKRPAKKIETSKPKVKVKFGFSASVAGSTFECALTKSRKARNPKRAAAFEPCDSPAKYKLKPGRYLFSVRATAGGLTGALAQAKFKIVEKAD